MNWENNRTNTVLSSVEHNVLFTEQNSGCYNSH